MQEHLQLHFLKYFENSNVYCFDINISKIHLFVLKIFMFMV